MKKCADAGSLFHAAMHVTMGVMETTLLYAAKYKNIQERVYSWGNLKFENFVIGLSKNNDTFTPKVFHKSSGMLMKNVK